MRTYRSNPNPEVEEVLGALSFLLSGGGVGQLGTITEELNDVMDGRTGRLRSLLGSLDDVVGTLDDQKADIIDALDSLNNLTATLNRERATIQGALDVAGPAIAVLDDQHTELVQMLGSLDRLGVVGTRVIRSSKDDLLASLEELRPILSNLSAAGDELAPGLNLLVSFPFPKEASEIVRGDYANTSIRADIRLDNLFDSLGLDGVPLLEDLLGLPDDVGQAVDQVLACLRSGSVTSQACTRVLADLRLLPQLVSTCDRARFRTTPVCRALGGLTGAGGLLPGLPDLPELPGLPGLSRLTVALSGTDEAGPDGPDGPDGPGSGGLDQLFGGTP